MLSLEHCFFSETEVGIYKRKISRKKKETRFRSRKKVRFKKIRKKTRQKSEIQEKMIMVKKVRSRSRKKYNFYFFLGQERVFLLFFLDLALTIDRCRFSSIFLFFLIDSVVHAYFFLTFLFSFIDSHPCFHFCLLSLSLSLSLSLWVN